MCLAVIGCAGPSVPDVYTDSKALPKIYPDYTDVTIPINIAPLTFQLDEEADMVTVPTDTSFSSVTCMYTACAGRKKRELLSIRMLLHCGTKVNSGMKSTVMA